MALLQRGTVHSFIHSLIHLLTHSLYTQSFIPSLSHSLTTSAHFPTGKALWSLGALGHGQTRNTNRGTGRSSPERAPGGTGSGRCRGNLEGRGCFCWGHSGRPGVGEGAVRVSTGYCSGLSHSTHSLSPDASTLSHAADE